jgi:hypothetical protein
MRPSKGRLCEVFDCNIFRKLESFYRERIDKSIRRRFLGKIPVHFNVNHCRQFRQYWFDVIILGPLVLP